MRIFKPIGGFINDIIGTTSQNEFNAEQAELQRNWSAQEALKQRNWETKMSNTAHQREMQDLKDAGLNPVLSVLGGNGASTPSGASASGANASGGSGSGAGIIQGILSSMNSAATFLNSEAMYKDKKIVSHSAAGTFDKAMKQIGGFANKI